MFLFAMLLFSCGGRLNDASSKGLKDALHRKEFQRRNIVGIVAMKARSWSSAIIEQERLMAAVEASRS
jgi:hypothetical protein